MRWVMISSTTLDTTENRGKNPPVGGLRVSIVAAPAGAHVATDVATNGASYVLSEHELHYRYIT